VQPISRTVSSDRDWIVNYLEETKDGGRHELKVEIARDSTFFPGSRVFHRSWSKDTSLVGRDDFILNTPPSDAATENRGEEIEQVQEWDNKSNQNINPGLRHYFRAARGECFRHPEHAQSPPKCGQEQRKHEERNNLRGGTGFHGKVEGDRETQDQSETKEKMCHESADPHFRAVDACDFDLAIREFEEAWEIGLDVGGGEAFGKKNNLAAGSLDGDGEGVVVAESVLPDIEHVHLFEEGATNGGAASPAEVFPVVAEHGDYGSIPGREKGVGKSVVVGDEPTHGGGGGYAGVGEGRDDVVEPCFARAAVGINENKDFKIRRELFDADAKVVDFFAGAGGLAGDDDVGFDARGGGDAFDHAIRGIIFGSEDEKDFKILVSEFAEGDEVALETGFHATARAKDGGTGSIKARVGVQAATHVGEPLNSPPKQEKARGDLKDRQKFEESFHVTRA
jgi:hypothetical protein